MTSTESPSSMDVLKDKVSELVLQCREQLSEDITDVTQVHDAVKAYCEAVAALPKEQGQRYAQDLELMMDEMNILKLELMGALNQVSAQITGLGRLKHANIAYQKSDAIGEKKIVEEPELEDPDL